MSALNIYLRPDVSESSVTSFLESYILTIGRVIPSNDRDSNQSKPVLKLAIQGDRLTGFAVTLTIDVNAQYLHLLRIAASVENSSTSINLTFSMRECFSSTHTRIQNALLSQQLDLASSNSVYKSLLKGVIQVGLRIIQKETTIRH